MPSSTSRADNLEAIQRAEEATVVLGIVSSHVDTAVRGIVSNMVSHYRGGKIEHDILVGGVAEISILMAMVDHLKTVQRTGEQAADREFNSGKSKDDTPPASERRARVGSRGAEFRRSQPS